MAENIVYRLDISTKKSLIITNMLGIFVYDTNKGQIYEFASSPKISLSDQYIDVLCAALTSGQIFITGHITPDDNIQQQLYRNYISPIISHLSLHAIQNKDTATLGALNTLIIDYAKKLYPTKKEQLWD